MYFSKESLREEFFCPTQYFLEMFKKKEWRMHISKFRNYPSYNIRICGCLEEVKTKTR
jgi:hypothetical protein